MSIESVSLSEEDIPGANITRESVEECTVVQLSRGAKTSGVQANLVPRACDPREGTRGSGIIRFREESDWPLKWNA
jgi:hypothetical protein